MSFYEESLFSSDTLDRDSRVAPKHVLESVLRGVLGRTIGLNPSSAVAWVGLLPFKEKTFVRQNTEGCKA